jgi:hypothetical protein
VTRTIYLTFDVDWVNDDILSPMINKLQSYGLQATFFATHQSRLLNSLDRDGFEIGLHPNFDTGDGKIDSQALSKLKEMYPNAVGTRSHTLLFGSRILSQLHKCSLRYESNIYLHRHTHLRPVLRTRDILSIPFNWSDDKHLELNEPFQLSRLPDFDSEGLIILNFHPIHLYLNTDQYSRYEEAKQFFNKPEIDAFINHGQGMATLFEQLCEKIRADRIRTGKLADLLDYEYTL